MHQIYNWPDILRLAQRVQILSKVRGIVQFNATHRIYCLLKGDPDVPT